MQSEQSITQTTIITRDTDMSRPAQETGNDLELPFAINVSMKLTHKAWYAPNMTRANNASNLYIPICGMRPKRIRHAPCVNTSEVWPIMRNMRSMIQA